MSDWTDNVAALHPRLAGKMCPHAAQDAVYCAQCFEAENMVYDLEQAVKRLQNYIATADNHEDRIESLEDAIHAMQTRGGPGR
jgi:hypothetical protein